MGRTRKISLEGVPYADCGREIPYPQGLKWTRQRKNVYKILWEAEEPLSAIQIYNRTEELDESSEYAISTIYRILTAFEEKGFLEKTAWMGEKSEKGHTTVVYELKRQSHVHYAVCLECRKRIPLKNCPFAHMPMGNIGSMGEESEDFTVTNHKLEIYGYCKECKSAKDSDFSR